FLGFKVNSGEYKMMGLAPYADYSSKRVSEFIQTIKEILIDIKPDGSIRLNMVYFEYAVGLRMVDSKKWEKIFGIKKRLPEEKLEQVHADLAYAAQKVMEEILVLLIKFVKKETNENYLCFSGGVALNCVANSVLFSQKGFEDIYIQPAAGDSGGAVGAALAVAYMEEELSFDGLKKPFNVYLGPQYSNHEIERVLRKYKCNYQYFEKQDEL